MEVCTFWRTLCLIETLNFIRTHLTPIGLGNCVLKGGQAHGGRRAFPHISGDGNLRGHTSMQQYESCSGGEQANVQFPASCPPVTAVTVTVLNFESILYGGVYPGSG